MEVYCGKFSILDVIAIRWIVIFLTCLSFLSKEKEAFGKDELIPWNMKLGDIGEFLPQDHRCLMNVEQVLDESVLVHYESVGSQNFPDRQGMFLVEGINTNGIVTDSKWLPDSGLNFKVTGTKTYETIKGGTKTVFVLSSLSNQLKFPAANQAIDKSENPEWKNLPKEVANYLRITKNNSLVQFIEPPTMKIGDIGQFNIENRIHRTLITQVFEKKILVRYDWPKRSNWQKMASGNFFVEGIDPTGLVSDSKWEPFLKDYYEVTGTTTYKTVDGGTNTVFVLSKVKPDRIDAFFAAKNAYNAYLAANAAEAARKAKEEEERIAKIIEAKNVQIENAKWHTWNLNGDKVEAKINGIVSGKVLLKNRDGKAIYFPIENLTADEQEFLNRWRIEHSKPHTEGRGLAYADLQKFNQALSDYSKAIELNPKCSVAYLGRGYVKAKLGKLEEAKLDLLKAVELDSTLKEKAKIVSDEFKLGIPVPQVLATISVLEMRRLVRRLSGTTVMRL